LDLTIDAHVAFEEWTKGRQPAVLGTNSGTTPLAFQNWRRFKEAFAPELVERAIEETSVALGRPVRTCLDPCAGSGTTPLACQFLGVHPVAIEVKPYLADLIEAKLTVVDVEIAARRLGEVLALAGVTDPTNIYQRAAPTFIEPGKNGRRGSSRDPGHHAINAAKAIDAICFHAGPLSRITPGRARQSFRRTAVPTRIRNRSASRCRPLMLPHQASRKIRTLVRPLRSPHAPFPK
jgi:hypothetical protein